MGEDGRRTQQASQAKIQQSAKGHVSPTGSSHGSKARNTPAGRRLAALRKKKADLSDSSADVS